VVATRVPGVSILAGGVGALVLVGSTFLGGCERVDGGYPGLTEVGAPPSSGSSAPAVPSTSTTTGVVDLPLADPDDPEYRVLFSLPAGPDGATFEGGFEDWELTGPQAIAVAPDGTIWIADTNGRRLLHLDAEGSPLETIDTDRRDVGGLIDVAAVDGGVWGLEVVPALDRHRIVMFDPSGEVVERSDLPSGLHLADGLSGIAAGPDGQVWIELEGGARVYTAFDPGGAFSPQPVDGYVIEGITLRPLPETAPGMARFAVGGAVIERPVRAFGGLAFEGAIPGWVALSLSDGFLDDDGVIRVDVEIIYADLDGRVAATATYPLAEVASAGYVPQDFVAVAPDGRLIAMKPRPDVLDVVELAVVPVEG